MVGQYIIIYNYNSLSLWHSPFTLATSKLLILDCEIQCVYFFLSSLQSANCFFEDGRNTLELIFLCTCIYCKII